jgi:hypothetical protein
MQPYTFICGLWHLYEGHGIQEYSIYLSAEGFYSNFCILTCHTNIIIPVKMIGWKDRDKTLLVDPDEIDCLKRIERLNENAKSIYELYKRPNPACEAGSVWKDIVLSPSRLNIQQELKYCIQRIESMK